MYVTVWYYYDRLYYVIALWKQIFVLLTIAFVVDRAYMYDKRARFIYKFRLRQKFFVAPAARATWPFVI